MGHRQKGKHMKRKKSWHRVTDAARFNRAMKLMERAARDQSPIE